MGTLAHNSAQWSSGFGFSCELGHRQDIWQNYARTLVACRPRILMSAPVGPGGWSGVGVGIEGHPWWADELGSMSESDEDERRACIGEWCSGPKTLWFFLIFIRVLFTHLLPWDRQESSLSPSLCASHTNNTHTLNFPQLSSHGNSFRVYVLQSTSLFFTVQK